MRTDTAGRRPREPILDGTDPAGLRLTEVEVAALLGMTRTPVREAIQALGADGLVRPAGWGVTVAALDPGDLDHAYQVRAALEGLTAELAADRQRAGRIAGVDLASVGAAADAADATAAGRLQLAVGHNRRFHRRIAELARNPIALSTLDRLWDQILVSTLQSPAAPARPAHVAAQHEQLVAAIAGGRATAAGRIARQHAFDTRARSDIEGAELDPDANVRVVLEVLATIEQRDAAQLLALTHSEVTICWPPSLPGTPGYPASPTKRATTRVPGLEAWAPLQPTPPSGRCTLRSSPTPTTGSWSGGTSGEAAPPGRCLTARCWACTSSGKIGWPAPRCSISTPMRSSASSPTPRANDPDAGPPGRPRPADVPGRSPIAGHYYGHQEVLGYFAARRAHAKATFRIQSRAILADDQRVVQLAGGKIAACWLVPFDQYLFDELSS